MRTVLKYLAAGLLCLALLIPCACVSDGGKSPAQDLPPSVPPNEAAPSLQNDPAPVQSLTSGDRDPAPTSSGDVPALYPDEETELTYYTALDPQTAPALRHHSIHGYTIVHDATYYECRSYHEVDSYWCEEGVYLSVSIVYGLPLNDVLAGLIHQEGIVNQPFATTIGAENYLAYTVNDDSASHYRQFWVLDYAGDTMLIEQCCPKHRGVSLEEQACPSGYSFTGYHMAVQQAMLETLTLDHTGHLSHDTREKAYAALLELFLTQRTFPDAAFGVGPDADLSANRFAVYDIDRDGSDELLVEVTTTIEAAHILRIYDYDARTGRVYSQFDCSPTVTVYDNGVIQMYPYEYLSRSNEFRPYVLYAYDRENDRYDWVSLAEAWDSHLYPVDFPAGIDADGDGRVYYITATGFILEDSVPVDGPAYRAWLDSYLNGAVPVELPYLALTADNIAGLYS